MKILIADSDESTRSFVKNTLAEYNYDVLEATSDEDILSLLDNTKETIDVVLLNVDPKQPNPFNTLQAIKENPITENTGIIIINDSIEPDDRANAFSTGASDYIVKPFQKEELVARIKAQAALQKSVSPKGNKTKHRKANEPSSLEKQFLETDMYYRLLAEHITDVIYLLDNNLQLAYVSPSINQLRGYSANEVMSNDVMGAMTPASMQTAADIFASAIEMSLKLPYGTKWSETVELEVLHKDGHIIYTEGTISPFYDQDGQYIGLVGTIRDINDRKLAEQELRDSEQRFRILTENLADCIAILNKDTTVRYISSPLLGYTKEEIIGSNAFFTAHPDDLENYIETLTPIYQEHGYQVRELLRLLHKDGTWRWMDVALVSYIDDPIIDGIVITAHDVTDRKQTEDALMDNERRFRAVIENMTDSISILTAEGIISYISPAFEKMLGYKPEEVIGLDGLSLLHSSDQKIVDKLYTSVSRPKSTDRNIIRAQHKDGSWRWLEITATNHIDDPVIQGVIVITRDVTDRKQAEDALLESEQKFKQIFDNIADEIIYTAPDGTVLAVNWAIEEIWGLSPDEVIGNNFTETSNFNQQQLDELTQDMAYALANNETMPTKEFEGRHKDGRKVIVEAKTNFVTNIDGEIEGILAIIRDITDRKQTQDALLESEQKLQQIFDNVADEIIYMAPDGTILAVNWAIEEIWGLSPDEVIGRNFLEIGIFDPEQIEEMANLFMSTIENGHFITAMDFKGRHKDGREVYAEAKCSLIQNADGEIEGFLAIARDATQRKLAQMELQRQEEYYRALIENSSNGIMITDKNGAIKYTSPSYDHMLGLKPGELVGKTAFNKIHPEDLPNITNEFYKLLENPGGHVRFELRAKDPSDGKWHIFDTTCTNLLDNPAVEGIVANVDDITERKEADNALKNYAEEMTALNEQLKAIQEELASTNEHLEERVRERTSEVQHLLEEKDEFISRLGHDLKSPLTPLVTLLPMIAQREQDFKQKELLDLTIDNVSYMKDLVVKTLQLARFSTSTSAMHMENINLQEEFDKATRVKSAYIQKEKIQVINNISERIYVEFDRMSLDELIDNLVTNAIKFTGKGGTITFDAKRSKGTIKVSIQDTGIGMSPYQLEHIFHQFYKADQSRHELDSSGLGLAICKRIIEKQGGKIWAESEGIGKGSTFFFTVKSAKTTDKQKTIEKSRKQN